MTARVSLDISRRPTLTLEGRSAATLASVKLLDGGENACPRMLQAISQARRSVHLEVYAFSSNGVGAPYLSSLERHLQCHGIGLIVERRSSV